MISPAVRSAHERCPQNTQAARRSSRRLCRPDAPFGDVVFRLLCQASALLVIALAVALVGTLVWQAWLAIETLGVSFFTTAEWSPEPSRQNFGCLAFIYGSIVTSTIAMVVAVPLAVGTAAFLSEIAPPWWRAGSFFVEMLAAIPSVVYGFWGLYVFAPALQSLISSLGGPDQASVGLLPAGLVLGIMIVPYAAAVSFDVIRAVPRSQREGSAGRSAPASGRRSGPWCCRSPGPASWGAVSCRWAEPWARRWPSPC